MVIEGGGDEWSLSVVRFFDGWAALRSREDAVTPLRTAAEGFARLGATGLETWSRSALALALARAGDPDARQAAQRAEADARAAGARAALAVAHLALAELETAHPEHRSIANALAAECSLTLPIPPAFAPDEAVEFRCFGGFAVTVGGTGLDLTGIRPRARQTLRFLALHAGRPVHREVVMAALWPDAPASAATRRLHVALSALRRVLEDALGPRGADLIARDGDAYRLGLRDGTSVDVVEFDRAVMRGRTARAQHDADGARLAYERAFDLYGGELLPEDGPSEWLVDERARRRGQALGVARSLAGILLEQRRAAHAALVCERGLTIDRYDDELWRLRIGSLHASGQVAAASRADRDYEGILKDLGVSLQ
ncbi:MAG: BTAD domain-containing putative transcriptional regulator [Actinomycetota bacterium]